MSLSPLYRVLTNDLHVSTARPTSTAVSSGFVVTQNRSPPFGSHHTCSHAAGRPGDDVTPVVVGGAQTQGLMSGEPRRRTHTTAISPREAGTWLPTSSVHVASTVDSLARVTRREVPRAFPPSSGWTNQLR